MVAQPDDCAVQLFSCAIRVTKLAADGAPLVGAGNMYVSDAMAKATLTPVYDAGDEIKEKNACGATYIDVLAPPTFVRADLSLDLLSPDPYLHSILISQGELLSPGSGGVGFAAPPIGLVTGDGVSLEIFVQRMIDNALSTVHPFAVWALPRVNQLQVGARDFTNAAQHSLITGQCLENPSWGDGPANDFDAASDRVYQWIPCASIPTVACGPSAVEAS